MQVANYGVGGQYEPHFEFARVSKQKKVENVGVPLKLRHDMLILLF